MPYSPSLTLFCLHEASSAEILVLQGFLRTAYLTHNSSLRKVLKMRTGMTQVTTTAHLIQLICLTHYSDFQNKIITHHPSFT